MTPAGLTPTNILVEAERLLRDAHFVVGRTEQSRLGVGEDRGLLAEDDYGIVAVVVYETWTDLFGNWSRVQEKLVEVISHRLTRADPKAWDAYLVLLTPANIGAAEVEQVALIRSDTTRVRKLVAAGEELQSLVDVERVLLPVMPLERTDAALQDEAGILDSLPQLLEEEGIDPKAVEAMVGAFRGGASPLESLHAYLNGRP